LIFKRKCQKGVKLGGKASSKARQIIITFNCLGYKKSARVFWRLEMYGFSYYDRKNWKKHVF